MTQRPGDARRWSILVIDDEPQVCEGIQSVLSRSGYFVEAYTHPRAAVRSIAASHFDLALVDYQLPGMLGDQLIREMRQIRPETTFAAMTGYGSADVANRMLGQGAAAYFEKPILDIADFRRRIRDLLQKREETDRVTPFLDDQDLLTHPAFDGLLGTSQAMLRLKRDILFFAPYESNVLIQGESGSGKGQVAKAMHDASNRARGPFTPYNLTTTTSDVIEGMLFGSERGAYSGAERRPGIFEASNGGTVFLDEIGDLPLHLQPKLLTAVQDGIVFRLGNTTPTRFDARVIAATHVDLDQAVDDKKFRQDLLYRLNNVTLRVPPLRDRLDDVPLLAWHEIQNCNQRYGKIIEKVEPGAMDLLQAQSWERNNVRELYNVLSRAMMRVSRGAKMLSADDVHDALPRHMRGTPVVRSPAARPAAPPAPGLPPAAPVAAAPPAVPAAPGDAVVVDPALFELPWGEARKAAAQWFKARYVQRALHKADYNVTHAARSIGADRSNLHRMMRDVGIELPKSMHIKVGRRADDG